MAASFTSSSCSSAAACIEDAESPFRAAFACRDYDLAATLTSGQAFRWKLHDGWWEGVIDSRWVRLLSEADDLLAQTAVTCDDWSWLTDYLRFHESLPAILATFPDDEPMRVATTACRGLRLLRQDPWECLASFILSSTKQIVQIQQIIALLCERFGEPVAVPSGHRQEYSFPTSERLAAATEAELRGCKMGFRAPYLLATARKIAGGELDLRKLSALSVAEACGRLMGLPGVGRKIADCVLLFAYGFQEAFPLDVWVIKALRRLYFRRRRMTPNRLRQFSATYFGPYSGYAQQYLFHYIRVHRRKESG